MSNNNNNPNYQYQQEQQHQQQQQQQQQTPQQFYQQYPYQSNPIQRNIYSNSVQQPYNQNPDAYFQMNANSSNNNPSSQQQPFSLKANSTPFHPSASNFNGNGNVIYRPLPPTNYYQPQQQQVRHYQHVQTVYQAQDKPDTPLDFQDFNDEVIQTEPDEFILDLLKKPQDRLFLLKLELELEAFIKDEKIFRHDIPHLNSYQRLMVHKLAPYYKLNHYHDASTKGVYLWRTRITEVPKVRLPDVKLVDQDNDSNTINDDHTNTTSIEVNAANESATNVNENSSSASSNQQQPSTPQFKIMRRSAGSSPNPRGNGTGSDDAAERKNKTFEERQTAYEEARARIFQSLEKK